MPKSKKETKENLKVVKTGELMKDLEEAEESLRSLRFKSQGSRPKNVKEAASLKKKIARILTEINKKNK